MKKIINKKKIAVYMILVISITSLAIVFAIENINTNETVKNEVLVLDKGENIVKKDKIVEKVYLPLNEDVFADDAKVVATDILENYNYFSENGEKVAYLTFDDGPSSKATTEVLNILKEKGIKATFFVLGDSIDKNPESKKQLKRMAKEGHAIGIHSYSHDYNKLYPNGVTDKKTFLNEFYKTKKLLKDAIGESFDTRLVRFPGGHMSWNTEDVDKELEEKGIVQVDWNSLNGDAEGIIKSEEVLYENIVKTTEDKDKIIILMHDTNYKETTVSSLNKVLDHLLEEGFKFRTLK